MTGWINKSASEWASRRANEQAVGEWESPTPPPQNPWFFPSVSCLLWYCIGDYEPDTLRDVVRSGAPWLSSDHFSIGKRHLNRFRRFSRQFRPGMAHKSTMIHQGGWKPLTPTHNTKTRPIAHTHIPLVLDELLPQIGAVRQILRRWI